MMDTVRTNTPRPGETAEQDATRTAPRGAPTTPERTRCPLLHIHESELQSWYDSGWSYMRASEQTGFCIIEWPHSRDPVAPFKAGALVKEAVPTHG